MFLTRVCKAFKSARIPYAIVGGYAVALHGCVRGTVDIDFVTKLDIRTFKNIEKTLNALGLQSRLPLKAEEIANFREEYVKNRNLIAWNFYNPQNPIESVDILINHSIENFKTITVEIEGQKIILIEINDLISMKKAAGREQDLLDAAALENKIGK